MLNLYSILTLPDAAIQTFPEALGIVAAIDSVGQFSLSNSAYFANIHKSAIKNFKVLASNAVWIQSRKDWIAKYGEEEDYRLLSTKKKFAAWAEQWVTHINQWEAMIDND